MTREELENNYQYKVTKKALMREFPFIKDVYVTDEDLNKWKSTIYMDLIIDPFVLAHQYGFRLWQPIINKLKDGEDYWSPYLSIFASDNDRLEITSPIVNAMNELIDGIRNSPAIPQDFKLNKVLNLGSFRALPSSVPSNLVPRVENMT